MDLRSLDALVSLGVMPGRPLVSFRAVRAGLQRKARLDVYTGVRRSSPARARTPGTWYMTMGAHWLVGLGEDPSTSPSGPTSWRVRRGAGAIALVHLAARATHTAVTGDC